MGDFDWNSVDWQRVIFGVVIIVAGLMIERLITRMLRRLQSSGALPMLPARIIRRTVQWSIAGLVILLIAPLFRIGVAALWAYVTTMLAIVGVGFVASWSFLSNVMAGFIILVWRPFRLGDRVELLPDGPVGEVQDINTMFTVLRADDGGRFAVPNNQFLQHAVKCSPCASQELKE